MIGSVINGFFETGKHFIHFGFSDDQRRTAGNNVTRKCPQYKAVLLGLCDQMGSGFLGRIKKLLFLFVANEFNSTDQSEASGSSNHGMFLKITQSPISLSTPLGEGDDSTLGEIIEDQNSPNPDLCTMQNNLKEVLEELIQSLSDREARVLKMRFGIDQQREYTLGGDRS